MICDFCGKVLDEREIIQARHLSQAQFAAQKYFHCDQACDMARRKRDGFYKEMSVAGRDGRKKSIPLSNHLNPRRRPDGQR